DQQGSGRTIVDQDSVATSAVDEVAGDDGVPGGGRCLQPGHKDGRAQPTGEDVPVHGGANGAVENDPEAARLATPGADHQVVADEVVGRIADKDPVPGGVEGVVLPRVGGGAPQPR